MGATSHQTAESNLESGLHEQSPVGNRAAGLRIATIVVSSIVCVIAPFMAMAWVIDSLVSSEGGGISDSAQAAFAPIAFGLIGGICGIVAAVTASKKNILIWTIVNWFFFVADFVVFAFLVHIGNKVLGSVICLLILMVFQMITCVCLTFLNTVKALIAMKCCC